MSTTTTVTVPPMAPTNTINPLPDTPTTAANRPDASATAFDLHAQTKSAAAQLKAAQKAEKAYHDKKKCMGARKDWYDCKEHFTSAAHEVKEGGKCLSRVIKAGPVLIKERGMVVKDGLTKKRKENKKEKVAVENGEAAENEHAVATAAAAAAAAAAASGVPKEKKVKKEKTEEEKRAKKERKERKKKEAGIATAATGTEKKKQTLDQVRQRILCYTSHFNEENEEKLTAPTPRENPGAGSPGQNEEGGRRTSQERRSWPVRGQGNSTSSANGNASTSHIPIPDTNPTSPSSGGNPGGSPGPSGPLSDTNLHDAEGGPSAANRSWKWSNGLKSRYSGVVGNMRGGDVGSEAAMTGRNAVRESSPATSSVDAVGNEKTAVKNKKGKMTMAEKKNLLALKTKLLLAKLKFKKQRRDNDNFDDDDGKGKFDSEKGRSNFFSKLNSRRRYYITQVRDLIDEILLRISTLFVEFFGKLSAARIRVGERSKKTRKVRFAKQKEKKDV
ncbi:hypothetical protein ACMFMG_011853 [Clarireedia jacksonii]